MDAPITSGRPSEWARLVAEQVEKAMPDLVVSRTAKTLRRTKILVSLTSPTHTSREQRRMDAP